MSHRHLSDISDRTSLTFFEIMMSQRHLSQITDLTCLPFYEIAFLIYIFIRSFPLPLKIMDVTGSTPAPAVVSIFENRRTACSRFLSLTFDFEFLRILM
jgi:hypothetical protein